MSSWTCERALERGLLPHTNLGVLSRKDLARLREVTASQGLMLESVSERLMETVHAGSPTKHPASAWRRSGCRGAEDPIHERDPRRDRGDRGGARGIAAGAGHGSCRAWPYTRGDPAELRPSPELLRGRAGRDRRRGRARVLAHGGRLRLRRRPVLRACQAGTAPAGLGLRGEHRGHEAVDRRDPAADARRRYPDPAEPRRLVGRARAGRRDRPRRPQRERRSHLPRAPVPLAASGAQAVAEGRRAR